MDGSGLVFTDEEAAEASNCLELHLKSYMWLAVYFYERRVMYFKVRCKTHYLFHVVVEIRMWKLNPTIWENFEEESFLGKLKRIAIRCHGGTCTQRVFSRYLLCLAMALREFQKTASLWEWTTSTVNLLAVNYVEINQVTKCFQPYRLAVWTRGDWVKYSSYGDFPATTAENRNPTASVVPAGCLMGSEARQAWQLTIG